MNNYWSKLPARYRGTIIITIPVLCLLFTLGVWEWSRQTEKSIKQKVDLGRETIAQSNDLLIVMLNAETGVRGYSLSKNETFLEPYYRAQANLSIAKNNLQRLVKNNPVQNQRLTEIQRLSQQRIGLLKKIIDLTRNQERTENYSFELNSLVNRGKANMDRTRLKISQLQKQEQASLNFQNQRLVRTKQITSNIQWFTTFVSAIAYLASIYLYRQLDRELTQREKQLRESKTTIEAIVSNVVDGVITLTKQGKIETFNPAAMKMFGYEADEIIGKNLTILLEEALIEQQNDREINFRDISKIKLDRPWQSLGHRKFGIPFPIEISLSDMKIDGRLIAIIRDITERQQAKEQLQARAYELSRLSIVLAKTNEELQERNEELDRFAHVVSHDLKAPLRAIANLSEWIEEDLEGKLSPENQHQMQRLRGRVFRLEGLINGLLEYYRADRLETNAEIVDVNNLLTEIIDSLDPPPTFTIDIDPKMPILKTKKIILFQVFSNLISNAIKHHDRHDGHIKISVSDREYFYEFAVADDGLGIAPEYHEKIFGIFETLQPRDRVESTGIGLAIVKKIIENEGGTIGLESQLGRGATFRFTWLKS
jgi:PAS domain S-box-containing protein